ncbi:MAG TPA: hypothetical protein VN697_04275, partial [Tepidiformaceae bacterium]|nr:hypothetical protein [Tepidiformaceae bacterium]
MCVPDEELRQLFRAAERDAVAGQDLIWRDVQALGDLPPEEVGREEAVFGAQHDFVCTSGQASSGHGALW